MAELDQLIIKLYAIVFLFLVSCSNNESLERKNNVFSLDPNSEKLFDNCVYYNTYNEYCRLDPNVDLIRVKRVLINDGTDIIRVSKYSEDDLYLCHKNAKAGYDNLFTIILEGNPVRYQTTISKVNKSAVQELIDVIESKLGDRIDENASLSDYCSVEFLSGNIYKEYIIKGKMNESESALIDSLLAL